MEQLKELFRTRRLSEKSPPVPSQKDIALFKSSPKQFVCVELLQEGNHKAFSELISLLSSDHGRRAAVKPGSARLEAPPLEEQRDKLEAIGLHLGRAELAERTGSWTAACEQRLLLGRYFSAQRDFWLSLYFYHSCADRERGGRSKPATEARGYLSELYLQQGDLKRARQQAELFLKQAEEGGWLDSDGRPLRLWASRRLGKIYTLLGEALLADRDYDSAAALLHQGYDMAKQCEDRSMEGEVTFRLGLTSRSSGDQEAARQFFNSCIQIYSSLQDANKLVQTYKAMAKSSERWAQRHARLRFAFRSVFQRPRAAPFVLFVVFDSEGNIHETLRLLQKSADVCRSSKLQDKLADVCLYLGNIYYDMNQHLKACEYFLRAYKEACEAGDMALQLEAQVLYLM
ncbi:tetratricopeptide repeat protein 29 isoform X2 [Kryptolebias marmoratus]|uniref:tetratricopeptide repeat protein 29 isoform X2 n=1 Tax=Kryptolebias marmoratus TaxID=37003 RepID=UPI000D52FEDA|nr:tetratricopeptide repeat protein 29 isoform X2 [Kryptolebias marmoratus]